MADVTLKDVAVRAGVHVATASRALDPDRRHLVNAETRQRVEAVARELGYRINVLARGLRKGSTGLIGVVVADLGNPFLPPILRGVEEVLGPRGYLIAVSETHEDPETLRRVCEQLVARRVEGIVISAAHAGDGDFLATVEQSVPVVLAVRRVSGGGHHTVTHDDVLGARLVTEHLVKLGHRRLAQLRGPQDVSSFAGRARGFQDVLTEYGCTEVTTGEPAREPTTAEGRRLAAALLAAGGPRPTAIVAQNDLMAIGALDALGEAGLRCPEDISIVGYNDAPLTGHLTPPLTTVRLPSHALGRRVATTMLSQLDQNQEPPTTVALEPELVIRASTAAPADEEPEVVRAVRSRDRREARRR
ncbi:LacI family DNA-binding transcriptional regulator [Amycolatopsis pithecellobii]|uniref:Substrate-binding domain-containing protein n=1 Tax=Amycolatopsis pithecellobii TaxID=664692 RepID=A0A6N7YMX6_9PSEU|nr:LacI family DNA-binding transcriptional regulator [Amycolatopsis pithecellobii]MTD53218.1 substrate-binding domain-containing protein [Amycolatopsis pithecellobii]